MTGRVRKTEGEKTMSLSKSAPIRSNSAIVKGIRGIMRGGRSKKEFKSGSSTEGTMPNGLTQLYHVGRIIRRKKTTDRREEMLKRKRRNLSGEKFKITVISSTELCAIKSLGGKKGAL